jgi:hypothetical protein
MTWCNAQVRALPLDSVCGIKLSYLEPHCELGFLLVKSKAPDK